MAFSQEFPHGEAIDSEVRGHEPRVEVLARRLEDGYRRIDRAALAGADVTEWESFWIKLLGEYEDVCREHDLAA